MFHRDAIGIKANKISPGRLITTHLLICFLLLVLPKARRASLSEAKSSRRIFFNECYIIERANHDGLLFSRESEDMNSMIQKTAPNPDQVTIAMAMKKILADEGDVEVAGSDDAEPMIMI